MATPVPKIHSMEQLNGLMEPIRIGNNPSQVEVTYKSIISWAHKIHLQRVHVGLVDQVVQDFHCSGLSAP